MKGTRGLDVVFTLVEGCKGMKTRKRGQVMTKDLGRKGNLVHCDVRAAVRHGLGTDTDTCAFLVIFQYHMTTLRQRRRIRRQRHEENCKDRNFPHV